MAIPIGHERITGNKNTVPSKAPRKKINEENNMKLKVNIEEAKRTIEDIVNEDFILNALKENGFIKESKQMQTLEQLEAKYEELGSEIEKLKQEKEQAKTGRWKPNDDEDYLYIDQDGDIDTDTWWGGCFDEQLYSIGNVFQTYEEAEFTIERLKVIAELKEYATEFVEGKRNWVICWDYNCQKNFIYVEWQT